MLGENKKMRVYVVYEDWSLDFDRGSRIAVFGTIKDARRNFKKHIKEESKNGIIKEIKTIETYVIDSSEGYYDCYEDGYSAQYHYTIRILEKDVEGKFKIV